MEVVSINVANGKRQSRTVATRFMGGALVVRVEIVSVRENCENRTTIIKLLFTRSLLDFIIIEWVGLVGS